MKRWCKASEIVGVAGLPTTPRGLNLLGEREGWRRRKAKGSGQAWEYLVSSLPPTVRTLLLAQGAVDAAEHPGRSRERQELSARMLKTIADALGEEISGHIVRMQVLQAAVGRINASFTDEPIDSDRA